MKKFTVYRKQCMAKFKSNPSVNCTLSTVNSSRGLVPPSAAGFTLVEMVVAVGLFAIVMLIATSALLSVVHANRKAHALQSVMNNLNVALDGMTRSIRMGSNYRCGGPSPSSPDCLSGGSSLYFEEYGGSTSNPADDWAYWYDASAKRLYKSEQGGSSGVAITAPEVSIESLTFYVVGTTRGDTTQPKVVVAIKGTAGVSARVQTTFSVQATAVQRLLDL
ncbi:MAG TPA: type II secretion system protein [Candidatus Paceibacterota bacterium]